jgi:hypothetical protein
MSSRNSPKHFTFIFDVFFQVVTPSSFQFVKNDIIPVFLLSLIGLIKNYNNFFINASGANATGESER